MYKVELPDTTGCTLYSFLLDDEYSECISSNDPQKILEEFHKFNDNDKIDFMKFLAFSNCVKIFDLIFSVCNDIDISMEDNIFFRIAIVHSAQDMVKYLIQQGINVTVCNNFAIKISCGFNTVKYIKFLIECGADIHVDDDYPICHAADSGSFNVCRLLVEQGANIHVRNEYPFKWVVNSASPEMIKYFIECGANVHVDSDWALRTMTGRDGTAITECIKILLDAGADVSSLTKQNLATVIRYGSYDDIILLINHGVDFRNLNGYQPTKNTNISLMIDTLVECGVDLRTITLILSTAL